MSHTLIITLPKPCEVNIVFQGCCNPLCLTERLTEQQCIEKSKGLELHAEQCTRSQVSEGVSLKSLFQLLVFYWQSVDSLWL